MATQKGRPRQSAGRMKKTSIALPDELIERLKQDALKSGFSHWSEQLRYEVMKPRGIWKEIKPYLPGQGAPGKA